MEAVMAKRIKTRSESGVALLMAIFTLMLLTALGLALLGAADMETKIAANYRDKQNSIYASLSGLQEARDRLIPSRCDTAVGTGCDDPIAIDWRSLTLPTSGSNTNIVYIINPDTTMGETTASVAPWTPGNKYYDTELCSNSYFSTLCTGGAQPSQSTAYQVYDDSQSSAGEYYATIGSVTFPYPLKYKWVRVSLKADNMTPVNAESPASGTQMCWNGTYEVPTTSGAGYNSACTGPAGIVLYNPITSTQCTTCTFNPPAGSGYSNLHPTVTISGGGGTGATATATTKTVNLGIINSITLTNPGSAYTSAPTVTITDPTGTGATATAAIAGGKSVLSYTVAPPGSPIGCYSSSTPVVAVSGGGGSGATAVPVMTGQACIANWSVGVSGCATSGGHSVSGNTYTVTDSGGNGTFAGTITFNSSGGTINSYSLTNPGSGYSSAPAGITSVSGGKLTGSGSAGCSFSITWALGYQVNGVNLGAGGGGSGYTTAPTVTLPVPTQPPGHAAPSVTANMSASSGTPGQVISVVVTNGGSGYSSAPTVSFSGGGGTGAIATANVGTYTGISSIILTNAGSGFTSNPAVTITDPTGSGASIQAQAQPSTLGRIYELTALAVTPSGSKTMTQMEVATPPAFPFTMPGALVLDAPNAQLNAASSNNYQIVGTDQNSCGQTAVAPKASVGVFDNPSNPTNPTETACITAELGGPTAGSCTAQGGVKSSNYPGKNASPDVENVYNQLGDLTTVPGVDALATTIISQATNIYGTPGPYSTSNPMPTTTSIVLGNPSATPPVCPTTVVYGNFSTSGNITGCGVLLVTGTMTLSGNYSWDGPIFVIGQGVFNGSGGGNGQIKGSLFVATTVSSPDPLNPLAPYGNPLATLGTPVVSFNINGGGGNGIQYDHCWSDNMLSTLTNPSKSPQPLKVLSVRTVY
jgi:Tfp pilus assembly protein PilX